jgi:hypothetical protein
MQACPTRAQAAMSLVEGSLLSTPPREETEYGNAWTRLVGAHFQF